MFYDYYAFLNIKEGIFSSCSPLIFPWNIKNVCDTDIYEKNDKQLECLFGNKIALIHILLLFEWWLMAEQSQTKRWGILPPLPCFRPLLQYIPLGHQGPHDLLQQWTPCTAAGSKFQVTCSEFRSHQARHVSCCLTWHKSFAVLKRSDNKLKAEFLTVRWGAKKLRASWKRW